MKFAEYEKLFLEEYRRVYYPNSKISLTGLFQHMVIYFLYNHTCSMFIGFLLGFQTMDDKQISKLVDKFMRKFVKERDKDIEY